MSIPAASVWAGLASLVDSEANQLAGKRVLTYSFGSGLAASLFAIQAQSGRDQFTLANIAQQVDLFAFIMSKDTDYTLQR